MTNQGEYKFERFAVTLYAFHIRTEFGKAVSDDAHLLWANLAKLGETFSVPELREIREHLICYEKGRFTPENEDGDRTVYRVPLLREPGELEFEPVTLPGGLAADGSILPVRLHDTYAASLSLVSGPVGLDQVNQFNPKGAFLPNRIRSSLGQTLILYAEPDGTLRPHRAMADSCLQAFLKDADIRAPKFRKEGRIFGSHIFEYESDGYKPLERCHVWVWLNQNPDTLKLLGKPEVYDGITDLLLCRSKILLAYHEAGYCFEKARGFYEDLETRNRGLDDLLNQKPEERLKKLEPLLTEVPSAALDYGRYLRDMEDYSTTIRVNAENYRRTLDSLSAFSLPEDNTEFLINFYDLTGRQFEYQIQTDLNYLRRGQRLSHQVIDTIRGMTEIDILRQLKENEEKEFRRQNELEILIAFVVAVLEGGTISAAINKDLPKLFGLDSHPDMILAHLIFFGIPLGLIAVVLVLLFQWWRR